MRLFPRKHDELESRLRNERPEPADDLVQRIVSDTQTRVPRRKPRLGVAFAVTCLIAVAFALTGGIGYAASTASSGKSALERLIIKTNHVVTGKTQIHHHAKGNAASNQYEEKVLICHDKSHTILVRRSEVAEHLRHGDYLGECRAQEPANVQICHDKSQTILVKESEVAEHLAHGDYRGECKATTPPTKVKKAKKKKVMICHKPAGKNAKPRSILVFQSSVRYHLSHGDYRGRCKAKAKV